MIEAYKLLHNVYDLTLSSLLSPLKDSTTRGHKLKLPKNRARTNIKAHSFIHRIVNDWNNLQDEVISAHASTHSNIGLTHTGKITHGSMIGKQL